MTNDRNCPNLNEKEDAVPISKQRSFRIDANTRGAADTFRQAIIRPDENHPAGKVVSIKDSSDYERAKLFLADDIRVYGREEYDTAPNTWGISSLQVELGRRKQTLGIVP